MAQNHGEKHAIVRGQQGGANVRVESLTPLLDEACREEPRRPLLQTDAPRVAHAASGSDTLPLHEALEVKGARVLKAPHCMQAEAIDTEMVSWQEGQAVRIDAQLYETACLLPTLGPFIALDTEIQALAISLGFAGPLEYPFNSQRLGWVCRQEIGNMVQRYGTPLPYGAEMRQHQPQVKHPTAAL
jgi:hypothetical protein